MPEQGVSGDDEAVIAQCLADLRSYAAPAGVLARLRAIDGALLAPRIAARWLQARAIAANRLGFAGEALGDLHEAARLLQSPQDGRTLSEIFRTIALVHGWRGQSGEAALALLRAVAEADPLADRDQLALALIEAGRLQMEIGRSREASMLLARGLAAGEPGLAVIERQRAFVNQLQATVASGMTKEAGTLAKEAGVVLRDAPPRLLLLAGIEEARRLRAAGDGRAAAALAAAEIHAPQDPDSFEHIEIAQARAEILLQEGHAPAAAELLGVVVARYAEDDLASREVVARLMLAQAYQAMGDPEEADRTLAAALRRAIERGLPGHADEVRSRLAARGIPGHAATISEGMAGRLHARPASDRFVRRRPLGAGGFASVARAYDLELGIEVALKRSALANLYDTARRSALLEAARTEVAAAARIDHPGVARIYGLLTEQNGDVLLIEEFIEGVSLRQALQQPIERARALHILSRLGFALAAIHAAGVLHRDIKPENILLRPGDAPVVVDFGIALLDDPGGRVGRAGTALYMSPEQARGATLDERSDIYALARVAVEMLFGELPPPSPRRAAALAWLAVSDIHREAMRRGLDSALARLLAGALSPHRRLRPRSAAVLARAFGQAAEATAKAII